MGTYNLILTIGSIFIGGLLLITINKFSAQQSENLYAKGTLLRGTLQLKCFTDIIEQDFINIGYCKNKLNLLKALNQIQTYLVTSNGMTSGRLRNSPIFIADSNYIKFLCDVNNDGFADKISYFTGGLLINPATSTKNTTDFIVYRIVELGTSATTWSSTKKITTFSNSGIFKFSFKYYKRIIESSTSTTDSINRIDNTAKFNTTYVHPLNNSTYNTQGVHIDSLFTYSSFSIEVKLNDPNIYKYQVSSNTAQSGCIRYFRRFYFNSLISNI